MLYIVPWRSAELGDLVGRPVNSLLDEVLEPVDRDVFRRQNRYFEALQPNAATPASSKAVKITVCVAARDSRRLMSRCSWSGRAT